MVVVKENSAHYESQQAYLNYLKNIKVGDSVYPGYDGKGGRCTACKVIDIKDNKLVVKGVLWTLDKESVTCEFDINNGKSFDEDEDFYQLIMWEGFDISDGYFSDNYLISLGLK